MDHQNFTQANTCQKF
uniref:Uncharacterized protein n=1 Tax=Rhizophora mucronata TaxID=61149 RepID=A0A2P2R3D3_RHIMU